MENLSQSEKTDELKNNKLHKRIDGKIMQVNIRSKPTDKSFASFLVKS